MRKTLLVVLSALALVLGLSVAAGAATKPAYKVTLNTSVAKSTAEKFITVSGKVTGPKAAGKAVTIQRRYAGGSWKTVATAIVKPTGRYSARVETPRGGTTSFRALKAKSSVRKAGVSAVRSIPVYQWLSLTNQTHLPDGDALVGVEDTVGGKTYPSIDIFGNVEIAYKLANLCTTLTAVAEYTGPAGPPAQAIDLHFIRYGANGGIGASYSTELPIGTPKSLTTSLVGVHRLWVETTGHDSSHKLVVGNPRVLCNASHLPAWTLSELK